VHSIYGDEDAKNMLSSIKSVHAGIPIVHIPADLSQTDLAALYRGTDALLHPSRSESFGLAVAEAMSCGLPVISTGHGAVLDFIDKDSAWLVPAADSPCDQAPCDAHGKEVFGLESAGTLTWGSSTPDQLQIVMEEVIAASSNNGLAAKAHRGWEHVRKTLTWGNAHRIVLGRLRALINEPKAGGTLMGGTMRK
jgi:glycosyltransferase involved in cell wall biosynthesis